MTAICSLFLLFLSIQGCQHAPQQGHPSTAQQRLFSLEKKFSSFTSISLAKETLPPKGRFEIEQKKLERLRMRYLDVVSDAPNENIRIAAMVRVAELHLDLAARVRRMPYPSALPVAQQKEFNAQLSRWALPLEATGLGILHQILFEKPTLQMSSAPPPPVSKRNLFLHRLPSTNAWRRRAALYLALHAPKKPHLTKIQRHELEKVLGKSQRFAAPRRLLNMGRLGQRSARRD